MNKGRGKKEVEEDVEVDSSLATIYNTYYTTAILEAGRLSLDNKCIVELEYNNTNGNTVNGNNNSGHHWCVPCGFKLKL